MLEFFRKYQSYIFVVVTIVIVISFSFFGTSNTIVSNPVRDQVVFTAIDGEKIHTHQLDEMVMFISTDSHDKQIFGGIWGPNFLNDGVIRKDFLKTGLANIVANAFLDALKPDLQTRHEKEKAFTLYKHPQAKFISQESVFQTYAPKMLESFNSLKANNNFHDRVELFLEEMNFPAPYSRYVIYSQEKQFNFVSHDQNLDRMDLTLFGYHTIQDWFGPRFMRLVAEVIINGAKIAEQKGYAVTKEEALADLIRNSQSSYNENLNNPNLSVANGQEYYNEQLRRLGMDQNQAVNIWRQVLLFRRLFNDIGQSVFVDSLTFQNFNEFASANIIADAYQLPKELQFSDYDTMQKFEVYLNSVARSSKDPSKLLLFPEDILTVAEVSRRHPELVQKRYLIKVSEVNKNQLLAKVSLKETWNFEVDHFDLLKEKFPELGIKNAESREDRFKALDSLNDATRFRVDTFARNEIVDSHPEWLTYALEKARERTLAVSLGKGGNGSIFEGLVNAEELIKELDKVELESAPIRFTANQKNYYLITVLDRAPDDEILTFAEAKLSGILDSLLDDKLRVYYQKNKEEKNWKSFDESKEAVADAYFEGLLKAIALNAGVDKINGQLLAPFRFYNFMQNSLEELKKNPASSENIVFSNPAVLDPNKLSPAKSLDIQWKLQKVDSNFTRDAENKNHELFNLPLNSWSEVITAPNGDISFFYLKEKGISEDNTAYLEKIKAMQSMLGDQAKCEYMKKMIGEIQAAHAIALDYMDQAIETLDPEIPFHSEME